MTETVDPLAIPPKPVTPEEMEGFVVADVIPRFDPSPYVRVVKRDRPCVEAGVKGTF